MWKRKREHEEQWEGTREQRVSLIRLPVLYVSFYWYLVQYENEENFGIYDVKIECFDSLTNLYIYIYV